MYRKAEQRLSRLINSGQADLLAGGRIGLEKESLRVTPEGNLSQRPHPEALGSPLTHPSITTDYSEALAEFITPPLDDAAQALAALRDTQRFVYDVLERDGAGELLWATSMPCVVAGETSIPIAQYGPSNAGTMKTVYRRGLGLRYGRVMQVIAGVHFNYSFSDDFWGLYQQLEGERGDRQAFVAAAYFGLIRNLQRFGWLVPYLFGASPAVCKSFLGGKSTPLESFDAVTYYQPFATSLRMGDIGYQNNREAKVGVKANYDDVDAYVASLLAAITTPYEEYRKLGVVVDGQYQQLNANILQIENEYYSTIRPKQIVDDFEMPAHALKRRGVQYVELRSIDVNAFDPLGIDEEQLHFLEAFLVFCLLHDSPPIGAEERDHIDHNELASAHRGRDPRLYLHRGDEKLRLTQWAGELLDAMTGVCELLDTGHDDVPYSASLAAQQDKVRDPERTPSARMLAGMREAGEGFFHFAMRKSQQHQAYFQGLRLTTAHREQFERLAKRSWQRQRDMEAADHESFADYLQRYLSQAHRAP